MPSAVQSADFATVATYLANSLATAVGLDRNQVRIVAEASKDHLTFSGQYRLLIQFSSPLPHNPNFGAGRRAFPVHRVMTVTVCTRSNLDQPGQDEVALKANYVKQDDVLNALLLVPTAGYLVVPPKLVGSEPTTKFEKQTGTYTTDLSFELQYVLPINPAVAGGSRS